MSFKYKEDETPEGLEYRVWQREPLIGNLVIVVIDDEFDFADKCPGTLHEPSLEVFPLLRTHATSWDNTRAIGFFDFTIKKEDVAKDLEHIQKWIDEIKGDNTQVYFLVDVRVGPPGDAVVASDPYMEGLRKLYPTDQIAYLTKSPYGHGVLGHLDFQKGDVVTHAIDHGELSPKFMAFLGIGMHTDNIIDDAIQFYARAWAADWQPKGWDHDSLEDKYSDQLEMLAEWITVSTDILYKSPCDGESAKCLMIWVGEDLWENPPWKVNDRRSIQGAVLQAVLDKLEIPLTVSPDASITPPCVPCFPFLVSLRSFLWRCENKEKNAKVYKMCFLQEGENPQKNILSLVLPSDFDIVGLEKSFCAEKNSGLTGALRDLVHCKTHKLTEESVVPSRDYMRLFGKRTEKPVVEVEFPDSNQIDLAWYIG